MLAPANVTTNSQYPIYFVALIVQLLHSFFFLCRVAHSLPHCKILLMPCKILQA
jgi:hypothetical protein